MLAESMKTPRINGLMKLLTQICAFSTSGSLTCFGATAISSPHQAFWQQVTNAAPVVQFQYARSFEGASAPASDVKAGLYVPSVVVFDVKMQDDGFKVRYSDKLGFTNTHKINEAFHFAVGGSGTNIWSMGAAKQVTYQSVTKEEIQSAATVGLTGNRRGSLKNSETSVAVVLQAFTNHRRESTKVLRLGLPFISPGSLSVSGTNFHATDVAGNQVAGSLDSNGDGRIAVINYSVNGAKPPRSLSYLYEGADPVPVVIREHLRPNSTNSLAVCFRILSPFSYPGQKFSAVELSPVDYIEANREIRQFVRTKDKQFSIDASGKLREVAKGSSLPLDKRSKWPALIFWGVCFASIVVVSYKIRRTKP